MEAKGGRREGREGRGRGRVKEGVLASVSSWVKMGTR